MKTLENTEYAQGFADATNMDIESACTQISAMSHEFDEDNYDEGYRDGEDFREIYPNGGK